jgi:magnesium transporter
VSSFETLHTHSPDVDLLKESWSQIAPDDRLNWFRRLSRSDAEELFLNLGPSDQAEWFSVLDWSERRSWLRLLPLDDSADLIQEFPLEERERLIGLLDRDTAADVTALLAYAEDAAGGLMNPRFVRLRPDVTVDVAVRYLRTQARKQVETIHYAYVIGPDAKLMGTVSFRDLLLASPDKLVSEIMETDLITVPEHMDQEEVSRKFSHHGLTAIPVVDGQGLMKGIVSVDDVVDVVQEEATEDMHKLGGTAALEDPYLQVPLFDLVKKRAGWLVLLFVSEMFTATVMGFYEKQIERAVVLALFIPLIISSGGNSGSQASTLIIRAMALGEVKLRDYGRVFFRELRAGLLLGGILGVIGLLRILFWPGTEAIYGPHYFWIGLTVSLSLLGIVLWGTITGSMLPFLLKRFGLDPASASAPFVATLVDVTGIMIYFTLASLLLKGLLL